MERSTAEWMKGAGTELAISLDPEVAHGGGIVWEAATVLSRFLAERGSGEWSGWEELAAEARLRGGVGGTADVVCISGGWHARREACEDLAAAPPCDPLPTRGRGCELERKYYFYERKGSSTSKAGLLSSPHSAEK